MAADESVMSGDDAERWLAVPDWEGFYEVSDLGNVRSLHRSLRPRLRGNLLSPGASEGSRLSVVLYRNGERRTRLVHQLVLEAFIGPRPDGMEALHGPGGALDNRLANLSWGTHAVNVGPDKVRDGTSNRGERQGRAKLTEQIVTECRRRYAAGERLKVLISEYGTTTSGMSNAISGKTWHWLLGAVPVDRKRHGRQGAAHHAAKLTAEIVLECRARYAHGEAIRALAREFGVRQPSMQKAIHGRTWKHL